MAAGAGLYGTSPDRPELWLAAALQDWHERTPDRVPALPGWRGRRAWRSRREAEAMAALIVLPTERDEALARYAQQEVRLSAAVDAAAAADAEERRLLTAQGAALFEAAAVALRALGFDVEDADSTPTPEGKPKVEDGTETSRLRARGRRRGGGMPGLPPDGETAPNPESRLAAEPFARPVCAAPAAPQGGGGVAATPSPLH